jgi:type IV pilus assembly protein PilB
MSTIRKKLGELLLDAGLIDELQLRSALVHQSEWGGRLGAILIRKGFVKELDMISAIEKQMGMSCVPLEEFEKPSDDVLHLVKENIARKFGILPMKFEGNTLVMATSDPTDLKTLDDLSFLLGTRIKPVLALESDILTAIDHFYDPLSTSGKLYRQSRGLAGQPRVSDTEFEIIRSHRDSEKIGSKPKGHQQGGINFPILESVIDLLIEKGIFTREELAEKMHLRK